MTQTEIKQTPDFHEDSETTPAISFEAYRDIYDSHANSFRLLGILNKEMYESAVADHSTVMGGHGANRLPVLVPIEYAVGYDAPKTNQLTGSPKTMLLSIPLALLNEVRLSDATEKLSPGGMAVLVESPQSEYASAKDEVKQSLSVVSELEARDFLDDQLANEDDRPASMSIFRGRLVPVNPDAHTASSLEEAWRQSLAETESAGQPIDMSNGTRFFTAEGLSRDDELTKKLWNLCQTRFSEMGENHPVSMEEDEQFFMDMLLDKDTYTTVKFVDGEPVCLGFLRHGLENCPWLSRSFIEDEKEAAEAAGEQVMYFPEIVSKKDGAMHAADVIKLQADLAAKAGITYRLLFECSNRAATYIPRIVARYINNSGSLRVEEGIERVDRLFYWYLAPSGQTAA